MSDFKVFPTAVSGSTVAPTAASYNVMSHTEIDVAELRRRIQKRFRAVVDHLTDLERVMDALYEKDCFTPENVADVEAESTEYRRIRRLLRILSSKSDRALGVFMEALMENNEHVYKEIMDVESASQEGATSSDMTSRERGTLHEYLAFSLPCYMKKKPDGRINLQAVLNLAVDLCQRNALEDQMEAVTKEAVIKTLKEAFSGISVTDLDEIQGLSWLNDLEWPEVALAKPVFGGFTKDVKRRPTRLETIIKEIAMELGVIKKSKDRTLSTEIDWSDVKFEHQTSWEAIEGPRPSSRVIWNDKFWNESTDSQKWPQVYEKTTNDTLHVECETDFMDFLGPPGNVRLDTPLEILEECSTYKRSYPLDSPQHVVDEVIKWCGQFKVRVNPYYKAEAKVIIHQLERRMCFSVRTKMSGSVTLRLIDKERTASFDILTLLRHPLVPRDAVQYEIDDSSKSIYFTTKGQCLFKYGLRRDERISQTPLDIDSN